MIYFTRRCPRGRRRLGNVDVRRTTNLLPQRVASNTGFCCTGTSTLNGEEKYLSEPSLCFSCIIEDTNKQFMPKFTLN